MARRLWNLGSCADSPAIAATNVRPMKPRALNVLCLILLIGLGLWSLVLWHDGKVELATYAAVWAMLAPTLVRSLLTV